jgi:glycosyltransferase involved in cell wall biosynthesis
MPKISQRYALIIPALNEGESLRVLLPQLPRETFSQIVVVDNGSQDATAEVVRAAGVQVVREPRRGYGQACLTGMAELQPNTTAVAFMDADLSDDPADLAALVRTFESGGWDLVIGSRVRGEHEPGSLTPLQRFGNWLTTRLLSWIWHVSFTDLGPLRVIRRDALARLNMRDRTFGWTVEMQARAASLGLRMTEIPVRYRRRQHGRSKISGSLWGGMRAGWKIFWTVLRCWWEARAEDTGPKAGPS